MRFILDPLNWAFGLAMMWMNISSNSKDELPTVYEYFTDSTQTPSGLIAVNQRFTLNGKEIRIIAGGIHYFRVHPSLWRDRLKKLRALGANTLETYVAWNIHEPRKNQFDFGNGQDNDFSQFTDIRAFIEMAQEEDLLVLFRPGPYICTEWDLGGLPSWLLRDPNMKVRENYQPYLDRVKIYLDKLLPKVKDLQFTRGGPIIGFQIENEYGSDPDSTKHPEYLEFIKNIFDEHGLNESLYFTSDSAFRGDGMEGSLPGVLQTANLQDHPENHLTRLREIQPDMPLMVMEFWVGWFNHWGDKYRITWEPEKFENVLEEILGTWNGSVNFYMFHGGTNFGFMAGGNIKEDPPYIGGDTTSYDYDALLTEAGDYTQKYEIALKLIEKHAIPKLQRPNRPPSSRKIAYPTIYPKRYLSYKDLISQVPSTSKFVMKDLVSMENLPMNNDSGQSFGYVIYRKNLIFSPEENDKVYSGVFQGYYPKDIGVLIVDDNLVENDSAIGHDKNNDDKYTKDYWVDSVKAFPISVKAFGNHTIDLMVESLARINFGNFQQQKGIVPGYNSSIRLNGKDEEISTNFEIFAMEFTNKWVKSLTGFHEIKDSTGVLNAPVLIEFSFEITGVPKDTFLDMSGWNKGIVFVNGFNIGKYWRVGPQQNLYVAAPFLNVGLNTITVFEQVQPNIELVFSNKPNLGNPPPSSLTDS